MPRRITRRLAVAPEFRDIDIMGVVHNCVYFEWFERGRLSIMNEVLSLDDARRLDIAVPVVKNSCEYFAPVRIGDRLELLTRHKIDDAFSGKLEFSHELRNAETGCASPLTVTSTRGLSSTSTWNRRFPPGSESRTLRTPHLGRNIPPRKGKTPGGHARYEAPELHDDVGQPRRSPPPSALWECI